MKPLHNIALSAKINYSLLILCSIMFAIFFCGMPRYMDDYWYSQAFYYKIIHSFTFPADEIIDTWRHHYLTDNARLCNIVFVLFLLVPKWCGSVIASISWAYTLIRSISLVGLDLHRSTLIPVFITLCSFLLPWYDSMGAENYQFNYVIATGLSVLAISIFLNHKPCISAYAAILYLIFGIVVGAWHEGFSASLLAGMTATYICYASCRSRKNLLIIIGIAIGLLWIFTAPSFLKRFETVSASGHGLSHMLFISCLHPAFFAMLLMVVFLAIKKRIRDFFDPITTVLFVSALCSFAIHLATTRPPRTGWWCEFASIALITKALHLIFKSSWQSYTTKQGFLTAMLFCGLTISHLLIVDYYTMKIRSSFDRALQFHRDNPDKTVFADFITEHDAPLYSCLAPDFTLFVAPYNIALINNCLHPDGRNLFIPIPSELSSATATSGTSIAGNLYCRDFKGRLFMPTDSLGYGEILADVEFTATGTKQVRMCYHSFISPADGRRYAYLYPWRSVIDMRLGKIRSISLP